MYLRNLARFYVWEYARVWAHWDRSFDRHLSSLGLISHVFTSRGSWGSPQGVATVWGLPDGRCSLPSWVSSGLTSSPSVVAIVADDYDILCLLIWQEIFHFSLLHLNFQYGSIISSWEILGIWWLILPLILCLFVFLFVCLFCCYLKVRAVSRLLLLFAKNKCLLKLCWIFLGISLMRTEYRDKIK